MSRFQLGDVSDIENLKRFSQGTRSFWTVDFVMYWLFQLQIWLTIKFSWISSIILDLIMYLWRSHYAQQLLTAKRSSIFFPIIHSFTMITLPIYITIKIMIYWPTQGMGEGIEFMIHQFRKRTMTRICWGYALFL